MEHLQERFEKYFNQREEKEKRSQNESTKLEKVCNLTLDLLESMPYLIKGFSIYKNQHNDFGIKLLVCEEANFSKNKDFWLLEYERRKYYEYCTELEDAVAKIPIVKQIKRAMNDIEYEEVILYQMRDIILKVKEPAIIEVSRNELYVKF